MPQTEQQKFLEELTGKDTAAEIFDKPIDEGEPEKGAEVIEPDPEEVEEKLKNRRHKRLEEKLQKEREANIALNARVAALSEVERFKRDEPDADLHSVLYGTAAPTDETKAVAQRLQSILENYGEKAQQRAVEAIEKKLAAEREAEKEAESELDSIREHLEDDYNANLTEEQWKGYYTLMEKMSPKKDGEVIAYADPDAVWETYQSKLQAPKENRAKSLASRSMTQGTASATSVGQKTPEQQAIEDWLREG